MTTEIKDRISQLAEINRALAEDLDVSHKIVAKQSGEQEELRRQIDELNREIRRLDSSRSGTEASSRREVERLRMALSESQREVAKLTHERNAMFQDLAESRRRADMAERKLYALAEQYVGLEAEKKDIEIQFNELSTAMKDIRYNLISCCQSSDPQDAYLY